MTPERKRCRGNVYRNNYPFRCDKLEWKDGYCKHHHPELKRKKRDARIKKKEELRIKAEASITAEKDKEIAELRSALLNLMAGVRGLPPLTAIAGVLEAQYKDAEKATENSNRGQSSNNL